MTNEEVVLVMAKWGERLGLGGWTIEWVWRTKEEITTMVGRPAVAATSYNLPAQAAMVHLSECETDLELEKTVVHELVHIRLAASEELLDILRVMLADVVGHGQWTLVEELLLRLRESYVDTTAKLVEERPHG